MGMFFHDRGEAPPERPTDPEVRRANLRRIGQLFRPYWRRLSGLLGLIVVSAGLGVLPAFLLRRVLVAIQAHDTRGVSLNAAAMIVIAIVGGILGVIQTLLSNQVGQRVMHDLRAAVFRHLQRLSLAFFTRTRTGEVQSRINNDIGGVQNVVTNTATSITSSLTTVVATMIGMLFLSWQLALFAFALIPLFALLTRRVGNERRRIAKTTQESLADISSIVQESLSVSGILLGKTMGRGDELADRFEGDSQRLADLEVRQRMAGRWVMAAIQTSFAVMPAAVYWFGGLALAHGSHAVSIPTLGYLAARLYDVGRGSITIGGIDIRDLSFQALADLVGVVSQETYLFHASVRDNLRFAKPGATDEEIEIAADAARIHHVIAALPQGYDTVVGERGYRFSGGEKQRTAIARTILRNPPILVLDEATSSLDTETERLVQDALDRLSQGRTTIAIAHRLSTVRDADQIIVLDHGRVVESGRHEDLILAGGRYTALTARDADRGAAPAPSAVPELAPAGGTPS